MSISAIASLSFIFVGFSLINRVCEGAFVAAADVAIFNQLLLFTPVEVFGLFSISVPNIGFFTTGLPNLLQWNYSFFGGNAAIIQYFLYTITAAVSFGILVIVIGALANKYFGFLK